MPVPPSRTPAVPDADPRTPPTQVRPSLTGGTDPWVAPSATTQPAPSLQPPQAKAPRAPSPPSAQASGLRPTSPRSFASASTGVGPSGGVATLRPGESAWETVHDFQIVRPLGRGGMAEVFLGQRSDGRHAAIKVLQPQYASDAEIVKRFMLEMKATSSIRHPHVIEILDFGELHGQYFIASEYMDAGTVRDLLVRSGGRLPPPAAEAIVAMLLMGLSAAHARHLIHRDIKPANVLLRSDGTAKLSDFGIARALDLPGLTRTGLLMGTPAYMSPEQASGVAIDGRSDLFSAGIVLYELLTGFNPFTGHNEAASLMKVIAADPPLLFEVNPAFPTHLEAFTHKLLARDPSNRFATADEAVAELARLSPGVVHQPQKVLLETMQDPALAQVRWSAAKGQEHFERAQVMLSEGAARRPQAILELYRAHTLAPLMTGAEEMLTQIFNGRDPFAAPANPKIAELEAALERSPSSHALLMQLAALHKLELAPLKAIGYYKRALRLRPDDGFAAGQLRALVGDEADAMLSSAHLTLKTQPGRPFSSSSGMGALSHGVARSGPHSQVAYAPSAAPEPAFTPSPQNRGLGRILALVALVVVIGVGVAAIRGIGRMISSSQETVDLGADKLRSVVNTESAPSTKEVRDSVSNIREQGNRQLEEAFRLLQSGSQDAAEKALATFVEENPKHPRTADARFELARLFWRQGRFSAARDELQSFRSKHPADPRIPEVRMMLGEASAELSDAQAAVSELEGVIADHASSPVVTRAMWRVGAVYERTGDAVMARKRYEAVLARTGPADELYTKASEGLKRLDEPK